MLDTLIKLGEQLSVNMSKWDDRLESRDSHIYKDDKKRNKKLYVLKIIFDVDNKEIIVSPDNLAEFSKTKSIKEHWLLQTMGARAGKTYVATLLNNIDNLQISLFGKETEEKGQLQNDIDNKFPEIKNEDFYKTIDSLKIYKGNADSLDKETIIKETNINRSSEAIIFCYASIINSELGINTETELSKLEGFEKYMNLKFFKPKDKKTQKEKLCYASGEIKEDVIGSDENTRGTFSAMFVQTTKNYASNFEETNFYKNYQLSNESKNFIQRAAIHLDKNYSVRIADIYHMIIPQFLTKTDVDFELILDKLKLQSDFLFKYNEIKKIETDITDEIDKIPYWINYLATDIKPGQSFKTTELIKDISRPYFIKILNTFNEVNYEFKNYLNSNNYYNFYSVYQFIPVKTDMKNNAALLLFKDIFEHRPIDKDILFKHFTKYLICQRSGQFDNSRKHRAYANVREQNNFDYAIFNAINTYLAFFEVLKKLKLLKQNTMEENNELLQPIEEIANDYGKRIENFFVKMAYTETQKALFYLGRVLGQVAYAQYNKNHKNKPVLNKINYNGMDKEAVIRLRLDLAEKARQYNIVNKVEFNFSKFTDLFNPNDTSNFLSPEENVFYILSGYSFGMVKQETENNEEN
ncbi:MAG: TM1802 family CRISPR-associated protein [Bacteroidota bacterium]|nr:TM1802 family CRISPR-associated protein [Bacteroidota bacterium]